jgi:hypothetical protein
MRRLIAVAIVLGNLMVVPLALAGSPHFVSLSVVRTDDSLTVVGKEAGLGDEDQIHIVISATASCINPGSHHPKAANKESVSAQGDFPVQNGRANFSLTLTATFQPECSPPMTVEFTDVQVCDTTHALCRSFTGTF